MSDPIESAIAAEHSRQERAWNEHCSSSTPEVVEAVTAALVALARHNIPTDVQELLVGGNPAKGIAPGALRAAIAALPPSNMIGEAIEALEEALPTLEMASWENIGTDDQIEAAALFRKARATLSKLRGEG